MAARCPGRVSGARGSLRRASLVQRADYCFSSNNTRVGRLFLAFYRCRTIVPLAAEFYCASIKTLKRLDGTGRLMTRFRENTR